MNEKANKPPRGNKENRSSKTRSGLFAFSFNDHTLSDPDYEKKVEQYLDGGYALLIHKSYGNHLPKANLKSNIYILKKL